MNEIVPTKKKNIKNAGDVNILDLSFISLSTFYQNLRLLSPHNSQYKLQKKDFDLHVSLLLSPNFSQESYNHITLESILYTCPLTPFIASDAKKVVKLT